MNVLRQSKKVAQSLGNAEILEKCTEIRNRNPRNLERLRIAIKPDGYHVEKPGHKYWHKLVIQFKNRYVTATIQHFQNGPVIQASSKEWALQKQLYSSQDVSACTNVGRVLAQRCLECGICEVYFDETRITGDKMLMLVEELKKAGISLTEPERYKHPLPWDLTRPEKPWETYE